MPHASRPALDEWHIDPRHSTLRFWLRHIVVHQIHGHFETWGGQVLIDPATPALSSVSLWIDLASVSTDNPERDEHIRSVEFFDVARFPRAFFTSTGVRVQAHANPVVMGRLSLHGVEQEVEVEMTDQTTRVDPDGHERKAYALRAEIDRRAFGLQWNQDLDVGGVVVGDRIEIRAHVETVRAGRQVRTV
jgi:polyisoprenoid-binding protein YceI